MTTTTPNRTTNSNPTPALYTRFDRLLIAGRWVTGRSDRKLQPIDPYTQEVITEIPAADARDIEDAYQEARRAQVAWTEKLPSDRSAVMRRASEIMAARREEIMSWLITKAGSTRSKAIQMD